MEPNVTANTADRQQTAKFDARVRANQREVAASVFSKWSHEALAFAQRVRAGEDGGPVRH
jgi:hypothetical protein